MRETFIPKSFSYGNLAKIRSVNALVEEYRAIGLKWTSRQLFYAFVSINVIENTFRSYKNFCELLKDARLSGHIDWDGIEDRTRQLESYLMHETPQAGIDYAIKQYIEDAWADQDAYVEVWIEKSALIGVLYQPCWKFRLPFISCRGYTSTTEIYVAAKRFEEQMANGKQAIIIHLGDHDPSGEDMTRDNFDRINLMSYNCGIEVRRVALTPEQIDRYQLPHQMAKKDDSRTKGYVLKHGHTNAWELDALKPDTLMEIISEAVTPIINWDKWQAHMEREEVSRAYMRRTWNTGREWQPFRDWTNGLQS